MNDAPVRLEDWPGDLECSKITSIHQRARVPGKIGNPGKEIIFFAKDGSRVVMAMKVFRQSLLSQEAIEAFKAEERESKAAKGGSSGNEMLLRVT